MLFLKGILWGWIVDIDALKAFLAVAEEGSFSKAAIRLHLTQPAVSKRIRQLEDELGVPIFDRATRHVRMTMAGEILLRGARRILLEVQNSQRLIANLSGEVSGLLRVGVSYHVALHRLPGLLRLYAQRYPAVELELNLVGSERGYKLVEQGELELSLVTLSDVIPEALLNTEVWNDPLAIVAAPDHPLVTGFPISLAALVQYPAILPAVGTFTRDMVVRAFQAHGHHLAIRMETNHLEVIRSIVSIGMGWSALPRTMVDASIEIVAVPELTLCRRLGFVQHQSRTLSRAAQALMDMAISALGGVVMG